MKRPRLLRQKLGVFGIILTIAAFMLVSVTLAYLVSVSNQLDNSFTKGNVEIFLAETTGSDYLLIPGKVIDKDPAITVKRNSEKCWLFCKIDKSSNSDDYLSYELENGWTELNGVGGVYYREVPATSEDKLFPILKNNSVTVSDTVTEEILETVVEKPTLEFTAYAVQYEGVDTPEAAWTIIEEEE